MQVQGKDANYSKYTGPLDCARKTLKNEGVSLTYFFPLPTTSYLNY